MKKHFSRIAALLLVLATILSLAACGSKAESGETDAAVQKNAAQNADTGATKLTMVLVGDGMQYPDTPAVEQAVAAIVKEKLNIDLSFKYVSFYDATTNMNLWLSTGEDCDVFVSLIDWSTFIQQGFLKDLTPYTDLMPNAIQAVGDYITCGMVDGKLYGIPSVKDMVNYSCYFFRKDILEAVNIDPSSVTNYEQMEDMLRAIKAAYPEMKPLTGDAGRSVLYIGNVYSPDGEKLIMSDPLINGTGIGLMQPTTSSKVECLYLTDFYEKMINMAYRWNKDGLIYFSDLSSGPEQILAGTAAGAGGQYKPGCETEWSGNTGYPMAAVCYPNPTDAAKITSNGWNWSVASGCKNVEDACRLIDLLFSDKEINNLLAWGVEGQDYVLTDEENVIAYPDGVDATNAPYYCWAKFGLPNNFLQYVMAPNPANLWEEMDVYNNTPAPSKAFGFTYNRDDNDLNGKIVEIANIVTEYDPGLGSGELDPSQLQEFRDKLIAAGIEDVIASVQGQLDAYMAG